MNDTFISVCIPNYNRPDELYRLLKSVDYSAPGEIEIVICDDRSPEIEGVRSAVTRYTRECRYEVIFRENPQNLGYDQNLRELIRAASGEWVLFMGNDDMFVAGALDKLAGFLKGNPGLGYVLKSHYLIHKNNKYESHRYYDGNSFFDPGIGACVSLFRKSVFISGFLIRREFVLPYLTDEVDGTLLFQLYLLGEVVLRHPSAYFDEPLTQQYDEGVPSFGTAEAEKGLYTPGTITIDNSINFLKGFFKITGVLDGKHGVDCTPAIKKDMSKYFYPSLAIQRNKGLRAFLHYVARLNREIGFNITPYYYVYVAALVLFGKNACDNGIRLLKDIIGKTPQL